jgi:predicted  nucleic acid-binding Zn-ribbon protein
MANEKLGITIPISFDIKSGTAGVTKEVEAHTKNIKKIYKEMSKSLVSNLKDIANISSNIEDIGHHLSYSAKEFTQKVSKAHREMEDARAKAKAIAEKLVDVTDSKEKAELEKSFSELQARIDTLAKDAGKLVVEQKKHSNELKKATKLQKKHSETFKKLLGAKSLGGLVAGKAASGLNRISGGTLGAAKEMGSALVGARYGKKARAIQSKIDSGEISKEQGAAAIAELGKAAAGMEAAAAGVAGIAAVIAAFLILVKKASDNMAMLNKSMVGNLGTGNDLVYSTESYSNALGSLRGYLQDNAMAFARVGHDVESGGKILGAYAQSSTGSIVKTADAMDRLKASGKDLVMNAIVYGKALGMSAEEASSMMGKMQTEYGMGLNQVQDNFGQLVAAAKNSNMSYSKFMNIFNETTPSLETYTNRMEELTGVIKNLSKTMSPASVKNFMNAFAKGFSGRSVRDVLRDVLVGGVEKADSSLAKSAKSKMEDVVKGMPENLGNEMMAAFKDPASTLDDMAKLAAKAASLGVDSSQIGRFKSAFTTEKLRQQGGPVNLSIAEQMGGGMQDVFDNMEAQVERFGGKKGELITGEVMLAMDSRKSPEEIKAYQDMVLAMKDYRAAIDQQGVTYSKSFNNSLQKIMKSHGKDTSKGLRDASYEEIKQAMFMAKEEEKALNDPLKLAQKQYEETTTMGEKLTAILGALVQKIYKSLEGIAGAVNKVVNLLFDPFEKTALADISKNTQYALSNMNSDPYIIQTGSSAGQSLKRADDTQIRDIDTTVSNIVSAYTGDEERKKLASLIDFSPMKGMDKDEITKILKEGGFDTEYMYTTDKLDPNAAANRRSRFSGGRVGQGDPGLERKSLLDLITSEDQESAKMALAKHPEIISKIMQRLPGMYKGQKSDADFSLPAFKTPEQDGDLVRAGQEGAELARMAGESPTVRMGVTTLEHIRGGAQAVSGALTPSDAAAATSVAAASTADKNAVEIATNTSATAEQAEDTNATLSDIYNLFFRGKAKVTYEESFLSNKYAAVVKKAVEEGVEPALLRQSLFGLRLEDSTFKELMKANLEQASGLSGYKGLFSPTPDVEENVFGGSRHTAEYSPSIIGKTGLYNLRAGEMVSSPKLAGKTINMHVNINVATDASPQKIASVLYDIANRA